MRYLGIDYGSAHLGLSIADDEARLALPYDTIEEQNRSRQLELIKQVIDDEKVDEVVVGLPLNLKGQQGYQSEQTMEFIEQLQAVIANKIHREDERLTSRFARRLIQESSDKGQNEHAVAAMLILQIFLDKRL